MRYGPSGQYGRGGMAQAGPGGLRPGISKPRHMRGFRDATGQLIVDHDDGMDNLSDKEIYARNIPAIGLCVQYDQKYSKDETITLRGKVLFITKLRKFTNYRNYA